MSATMVAWAPRVGRVDALTPGPKGGSPTAGFGDARQEVVPADPANRPNGQAPEQLAFGMADAAPYLPMGHREQRGAPPKLYEPAGQATGLADPTGHAKPAGQGTPSHVGAVAPGEEPKKPPRHSLHTDDPAELYSPAGHRLAEALVEPNGQA
jgi:hypothetical protein